MSIGEATTLRQVSEEALQAAREKGQQDATDLLASQAPAEPLLRVAWAAGYGQVDVIRQAVEQARADGATWRQLGEALGENWRTVQSKYGSGPERMKRYRERQRAKEQGD